MSPVQLPERPVALGLEHAFTLHVELAAPLDLGETPSGHRPVIPITGGMVMPGSVAPCSSVT